MVFSFFSLLSVVIRPLFIAGGVVLFVFLLQIAVASNNCALLLPPGPKPLPLVGNLLQVNLAEPWLTYTAWRKKYGDLMYVRLLGQNCIILNSEKMARTLLDQRSAVYSDRLVLRAYSMFAMSYSTALLPYGDKWRHHRKLFQHSFQSGSEARHLHKYQKTVRTLLSNLLDTPAEFNAHIKSYVASSVIALAYGYEAAPRDDPMVNKAISLADLLSRMLSPERCAILSAFPFLAKLPGWLPGGELWRDVAYTRELSIQVLHRPFNWVRDQMAAGNALPSSLVTDCLAKLDQEDDNDEQMDAIRATAATAFIAGFETTSSTLYAFILAMVLFPEVQEKAQGEIDSVIGSDRLPRFDDRASLPYVDAIIHEILRWSPVLPLGLPHATSADDVYEGYLVPKGSLVLINVWGMSRDEGTYADADEFKPERFLSAEGKLRDGLSMSADPVFGFGRRTCPGRFAAEGFMWMAVTSILATFRITKAEDADGIEIDVKRRFTTGLSVRPVDFACQFVPRAVDREDAVRDVA